MADLPPDPDFNADSGDDAVGAPRWVKVFGLIALGLVLLVVILKLTGHGPGSHRPW